MEEKKDIFDFIEKRPIETPDSSYFKDLADKVLSEAKEEPEERQAKIIPLYRRPVAWISGVAAAILVAFLMLPNTSDPLNPLTGFTNSNEPSRAEVLAYVNENIDDFDEELLIEFIAIKNLEADEAETQELEPEEEALETIIETETKDLQESLQNISDEEILEYLEMEGELDEDDEFILL